MNKVLQTRLGAAVKLYRNGLGISQEELAWRADMHRTYLADIERGVRNISLRSIGNLAKALEISIGGLLAKAQVEGDGELGGDHVQWGGSGEILLVEDSANDVELTLRAFKRAKLVNPINVVRDGAEALHYLFCTGRYAKRDKAQLPKLVLLDLNLPKTPGIEVLRQMKGAPRLAGIPVAVLSGTRQDRMILECARLGVVNYIIKPVSFERLCMVTPKLSLHWALVKAR